MEDGIEAKRRVRQEGYRLNVVLIPLLHGAWSLILCAYVFIYDLLNPGPFSFARYFTFVLTLAAYCLDRGSSRGWSTRRQGSLDSIFRSSS